MRKIVYIFLPTQCHLVYLHLIKVLKEQYLGFFGMLNISILIEVISMLVLTFMVLIYPTIFMFFYF
jgi:hypothetical protein